jgi:hypothetical protein
LTPGKVIDGLTPGDDGDDDIELDVITPDDGGEKTSITMVSIDLKRMEERLSEAGDNIDAKIGIYEEYDAIYTLRDEDYATLADLRDQKKHSKVDPEGDPPPETSYYDGGKATNPEYFKAMRNYALIVLGKQGLPLGIDEFNDLDGAVASTEKLINALQRIVVANQTFTAAASHGFKNSQRYLDFYNRINNDPPRGTYTDKIQINDPGLKQLWMRDCIIKSMNTAIEGGHIEQVLGYQVVNSSTRRHFLDLPAPTSRSKLPDLLDEDNSQPFYNYMRLGALIDVMFLPSIDGVIDLELKNIINSGQVKEEDEDKISIMWGLKWGSADNPGPIKESYEKLLPVYSKGTVDGGDIGVAYEEWFKIIVADDEKLTLTKMIITLIAANQTEVGFAATGEIGFMKEDELQLSGDPKQARLLYNSSTVKENLLDVSHAHLSGTGSADVKGVSRTSDINEIAWETIGLCLHYIAMNAANSNSIKDKALRFLSPNHFIDGITHHLTGFMGTFDIGSKKTSYKMKKSTGTYYDVMKDYVSLSTLEGNFVMVEYAREAIRLISKKRFSDVVIKQQKESKIFRSKDGSKILVERKDLRKIIKILRKTRRK